MPIAYRSNPWFLVALIATGAVTTASAQHNHVNAGARSDAVGSALFFANGARYEASSGFLIHLATLDSPAYGPIFFGGAAVTFTSLPTTPDNGGPSAFAALPGAHLDLVLETLDGPPGGALSVWDSFDGFFDATEITFTVPVGTRDGTRRMALSENDGSPGSDPYGHIHGRKFSATLPGLYTAGFRLVDSSQNGPGGGPLHAASELAYFLFQAGVTIADIQVEADAVRVRFGTLVDHTYSLETAPRLEGATSPSWRTVAGPIPGTGFLETVTIPRDTGGTAFFRLRVE